MNITRAANTITESIVNNNILRLTYRKKENNRIITRMVEPYEVKNDYLFAYDTTGKTKSIKSFALNNIISLQKQNRRFTPRTF